MTDEWTKIDDLIIVVDTVAGPGADVDSGFSCVVEAKDEARRARVYMGIDDTSLTLFARWCYFVPASVRVLNVGFSPEHRKTIERQLIDYVAGKRVDINQYDSVTVCDCEGNHDH